MLYFKADRWRASVASGPHCGYTDSKRENPITEQEQKEWDLKLREIDAQIANLNAATDQSMTENKWYIAVVASGATLAMVGATLAMVAIVKLFL